MIKYIPGTVLDFDSSKSSCAFDVIKPFFALTNGITLAQVRELTGLETSTIQNWVKRGWVPLPINKRYGERQIVRIMLINSIRRAMQIENVINLMAYINGDVEDTSDDVVSDEVLFNEFCKAVYLSDKSNAYDNEVIGAIVGEQVSHVPNLDEVGKEKLQKTLQIMVLAFLAGQIKDRIDEELTTIFS